MVTANPAMFPLLNSELVGWQRTVVPNPVDNATYMQKYGSEFLRLGCTHAENDGLFSVAVRVTVTRVRYFVHS